jgi:UDP-galactopyranose mutase
MTGNLVAGAGISGAVMARLCAETGEKVLVVDKKDHIAGNCYDYTDENGICVHKYGSHIFHTDNERVWNFLKLFTDFNTYMHKVTALIDGIETTVPFNLNTIHNVFPQSLAQRLEEKLLAKYEYNKKIPISEFQLQDDEDLKFLAKYVYEKVFEGYSTKQWGSIPDSSVTSRVPVYISRDNRYFQDKYQGIPLGGYTKMIENILNHPNIDVQLETEAKEVLRHRGQSEVHHDGTRIFYTGSIDDFFDYKFGQLPYRSVNFKFETHSTEFYQCNAVVNHPCSYDFTRIHEYKYYEMPEHEGQSGVQHGAKTVIAKEYSEDFEPGRNERYYPVAGKESRSLYEKYLAETEKLDNVYFLGRLGDYRYYDMDDAVERAINLFADLRQKRKALAQPGAETLAANREKEAVK